MGKLDGRIAIVTGGARGLGREFAHHLAGLGAAVGVIDISLKSYEETGEVVGGETVVDELRAAGSRAAGAEADVRDGDAMIEAVDRIAAELGAPTILVASAGGSRGMKPGDYASLSANRASNINPDDLRWVMEVNFYGTVNAVRAVVPHMRREKSGKIVTVASINGLVDRPDGSHAQYAAAKAAIVQYTRYLASDVGAYGIYANCLAPGLTITDKNRGRYEDIDLTDIVSNVAIGRLGQPEDQAKALEFLVTDASDYVTGHVLNVSGGTRVAWWGPPPVRDKD